jgi:hypothetical protein
MKILTLQAPAENELAERTKSKIKNFASSIFKIRKTNADEFYSASHWQIKMPHTQGCSSFFIPLLD